MIESEYICSCETKKLCDQVIYVNTLNGERK